MVPEWRWKEEEGGGGGGGGCPCGTGSGGEAKQGIGIISGAPYVAHAGKGGGVPGARQDKASAILLTGGHTMQVLLMWATGMHGL